MNISLFKKRHKLLLTVVIVMYAFVPSAVLGGIAIIDTAINPANGHTYYLLANSDWTDAENTAVALGGHLATVRSLAENNWLLNRWGTNNSLWIGLYDPVSGDGAGAQHAADFIWSSGESASYRNWNSGEPNGSTYTYMYSLVLGGIAGSWNDEINILTPGGPEPALHGVVEIGTCTPHSAEATAVLYNNNFVVSATITDPGCGYTNTPLVSIQGGGGSGATATATVTNGVVVAINITSTGSGYTNAPDIIIGSPYFSATVTINVSAVKVTQHLVVGLKYILQSSPDLVNWTAVGPAFTATNEYTVSEFEIGSTILYYRMEQLP